MGFGFELFFGLLTRVCLLCRCYEFKSDWIVVFVTFSYSKFVCSSCFVSERSYTKMLPFTCALLPSDRKSCSRKPTDVFIFRLSV